MFMSSNGLLMALFFLNLLTDASAVAIDNGVSGEPIIECQEDRIMFKIRTKKFYAGRIYAKGKAAESACVASGFTKQRTLTPAFTLPLGICGMKSLRSMDPRGMYYGITLVVSFHPLFLTKVDQAYHLKCFFAEGERGVKAELGVSMIPTTEANAIHGLSGCKYSIHQATIHQLDKGFGAGPAVQFARIGDKVLHRWNCVDPMFGVLVKNCYVTDGLGQRAEVIDSQGCPVDPILITGIRYATNLSEAYAESHVFKFADRPALWFFCQIQMCMKTVGLCEGITPPQCGEGFPAVAPHDRSGKGPAAVHTHGSTAFPNVIPPTENPFNPRRSRIDGSTSTSYPLFDQPRHMDKPTIFEEQFGKETKKESSDTNGMQYIITESDRSDEEDFARIFGAAPQTPSIGVIFEAHDAAGVRVDEFTDSPFASNLSYPRMHHKHNRQSTKPMRRGQASFQIVTEPSPFPKSDAVQLGASEEISGQLIVYDLDEDMPSMQRQRRLEIDDPYFRTLDDEDLFNITKPDTDWTKVSCTQTCVISRREFYASIFGLSLAVIMLLLTLCAVCQRNRRIRKTKTIQEYGKYEDFSDWKRHNKRKELPRERSRDSNRRHLPKSFDNSYNPRGRARA